MIGGARGSLLRGICGPVSCVDARIPGDQAVVHEPAERAEPVLVQGPGHPTFQHHFENGRRGIHAVSHAAAC